MKGANSALINPIRMNLLLNLSSESRELYVETDSAFDSPLHQLLPIALTHKRSPHLPIRSKQKSD